ncbi:MAG: DivIVA domain-containing protein [Clostridiales bacterium]|jgi:cell division initiation protein|nr:DivIVA domain-containing protein [Clostridiales bacterium]
MLTPQNFREKTFERAVFGGYDMGAVDDFLEEAANDYAAIAKENMVLKSKMKVLVDKIEEYRATEDSMRLTLLSAQKLSMQIEQESRDKAEALLTDSKNEAERIVREAYTQRATEEAKLLEAKRESTQYIENMRLICSKQLDFLDGLESMKLEELTAASGNSQSYSSVDETVRSIENSVGRISDNDDETRNISRVVSDSTDTPALSADEPTRLFSTTQNSAANGQFSIENLRFGK